METPTDIVEEIDTALFDNAVNKLLPEQSELTESEISHIWVNEEADGLDESMEALRVFSESCGRAIGAMAEAFCKLQGPLLEMGAKLNQSAARK